MADKPGAPTKPGEPASFQLTIPKPAYDYLTFLAVHSMLGRSENEVAGHLLIWELDKLFQADYHNKRIPKD